MNILKAIEKYKDTQKIKLGSASGFFYIGTVGDLKDRIEVIDDGCKTFIRQRRQSTQETLVNWLGMDMTPSGWARTELKNEEPDLSVQNYINALDAYYRKVKSAKENAELWYKRFLMFEHIWNREVTDIGKAKLPEENGYILIVLEGHEQGKFWTSDEAKEIPAVGFVQKEEEE